jgi:hypothetical protein
MDYEQKIEARDRAALARMEVRLRVIERQTAGVERRIAAAG